MPKNPNYIALSIVLWFILVATMLLMPTASALAQKRQARYFVSRAETFVNANSWTAAKREIDAGLAEWEDDAELRYLNGLYYYLTGHLNDARYNLIRAIQSNDQHFKAKRVMVDVEDKAKHYSSAICYINELLEFQPYDRDLWLRKIGLYRNIDNQSEADAALERLSYIYPNDSIVKEQMVNLRRRTVQKMLDRNNAEQAAMELEKWLDQDPNNLSYYLELIGLYQRIGETNRAIATGNRGLTIFPNNMELVNKVAGLLSEQGNHAQALAITRKYAPNSVTHAYLLQMAAANARIQDPYEMHGRLYAQTHDRDALTYLLNISLSRGYYEDARFYLDEAMRRDGRTTPLLMKLYSLEKQTGNEKATYKVLQELYESSPNDEELQELYADMMLALGRTDMAEQQWADADKHLQRAIDLMPMDHASRPAAITMRISSLAHQNKLKVAAALYETASEEDPDNRKRYAAPYEEFMANRLRTLIEEEKYAEALLEAQGLLQLIPESETALRCCINMSQTLKEEALFKHYALMGYKQFPETAYFVIKQAIALQQQGHHDEALALLKGKVNEQGEYESPLFAAAYSGIAGEWAAELLKARQSTQAMQVLDSALTHDGANKELLYMKGLAYEHLKEFDKAYSFQQRYYEPSNAELREYNEHIRYLGFRSMKNRVDVSYSHAFYDNHAGELSTTGHLYSTATVSYSRVGKKNTYTGQVRYKGIDGYHEDDYHEAGGAGVELMAQWDHTINSRWSGSVNASYATQFFNKISANISLSYAMIHDWTPSLRIGYRRTPETYIYLHSGSATSLSNEKMHLFIATPSIEKAWERVRTTLSVDLTAMDHSIYYNVGLKGKLFFNDDNVSSVALVTGFGSFPELTFFEQTALRNVSHTNSMVGFDAQYLCTRHLSLGLAGSWNTCFSPYVDAFKVLHDSYKNIYSLTFQIHLAF